MPHTTDFRADTCPLCGESNGCAVAAGAPPEQCWCMATTISDRALQQLPQDARDRYCICARCAVQEGDQEIAR